MLSIKPIHYKKLIKALEKDGFVLDRQEGDHLIYIKPGIKRPLVVPMYKDVPVFIIKNNLRSGKISRQRFFELLK